MPKTYPPELEQFVRHELETGAYHSEDELLVAGVRALHELKQRYEALREDIRVAIEELDRGEGQPLDMDAIKAEVSQALDNQHQDA